MLSMVLIGCGGDDDHTTGTTEVPDGTSTAVEATTTVAGGTTTVAEGTTTVAEGTTTTTPRPPEGTVPAWWTTLPPGFIRDASSCPEPTGAPIHYRDNAVVVFETQNGAAAVIASMLSSLLGVPIDAATDDADGIQRLVFPSQVQATLVPVVGGLQDAGFPVDFDYLHAILPNYQVKPDDTPSPVPTGDPGVNISSSGGLAGVIDVDFADMPSFSVHLPADADITAYEQPFDVDEFRGHGPFIADLIKRYANETTVELWPVAGANASPDPKAPGGTIGGAIDDFSLLERIAAATGRQLEKLVVPGTDSPRYIYTRAESLGVLNLSLGGFGCAIYPHLPLAALLAEQTETLIVAAAGNDGSEHYHFPAAFAAALDGSTPLADEIANRAASSRAGDVAAAISANSDSGRARLATTPDELIRRDIAPAVVSVGSATPAAELPGGQAVGPASAHPDGDCFSNRGRWVNTWAPGARQIGQLEAGNDWFYWSGTSFAAPRFTAAVFGASGSGASPRDFWVQQGKDPARYAAAGHPSIQFGSGPVADYQPPAPPDCP
jgi:hypothetical protein